MKRYLLDLLVCPNCLPEEIPFGKPTIKQEEEGDIIFGELICPKCSNRYPIKNGIAIICPDPSQVPLPSNKYENPKVVSSYLWSHYGDLIGDEEHVDSYVKWASLMDVQPGICLDIGCAVGRFSLEMAQKVNFVIGIDLSFAFIKTAREIAKKGMLPDFELIEEGNIVSKRKIELGRLWNPHKVDFLVADALNLPFPSEIFSTVASLNLIDKVPSPIKHLKEMDRVSKSKDSQLIISDPFSWSTEASPEEEWLGGKENGIFSGYGIDNIEKILRGDYNILKLPFEITTKGHLWWKIRTHRNHFELIRSLYVKARR